MDDDQQQRFARAVERKKDEALAASRANPRGGDRGSAASEAEQAEQAELHERGRPQDTRSVRDKNSGHGKKTADKWNQ